MRVPGKMMALLLQESALLPCLTIGRSYAQQAPKPCQQPLQQLTHQQLLDNNSCAQDRTNQGQQLCVLKDTPTSPTRAGSSAFAAPAAAPVASNPPPTSRRRETWELALWQHQQIGTAQRSHICGSCCC